MLGISLFQGTQYLIKNITFSKKGSTNVEFSIKNFMYQMNILFSYSGKEYIPSIMYQNGFC